MQLWVYLLEAIIGFIIAFYFIWKYIPLAEQKNLIGLDVHKTDRPKVAEMGGFGIVFGFIFGIAIAFPFIDELTRLYLIVGIASIILAAFIGVFDDLIELSILRKIILIFIASIPLVIARIGDTNITLPVIGGVHLGFLYSLIFVPLFFAIVVNMTNMLAGYNGLEAGMGIITISSFIIIALVKGNFIIPLILIPFLFALIAFYLFNRYPAKVFPGDVGTLPIGAALASAAIIGNMELLVLFLTIPYIIHFALYAVYTFIFFRKYGDPKISSVDARGTLTPMYFDKDKRKVAWHKLYFLMEHWFYPLTEQKLVAMFCLSQIVLNLVVILIFVA